MPYCTNAFEVGTVGWHISFSLLLNGAKKPKFNLKITKTYIQISVHFTEQTLYSDFVIFSFCFVLFASFSGQRRLFYMILAQPGKETFFVLFRGLNDINKKRIKYPKC